MRPPESFVGQSVRSLQTMLRLLSEGSPELPTIIPDGIYGPQTMTAVTAFQRKAGIPVTGVTDQATWEALVAAYEPALVNQAQAQPIQAVLNPGQVIRGGESNPNLYLAQAMLLILSAGYPNCPAITVTGRLDSATASALSAFQTLSALPATGDLDKHTWKHLALQSMLCANRCYAKSSGTR